MKPLSDNTEVSDATYYYLLDWNERDKKSFIRTKFNKHRLCDLTIDEYLILWLNATTADFNSKCGYYESA